LLLPPRPRATSAEAAIAVPSNVNVAGSGTAASSCLTSTR
jgi:hypothetical protein